MGTTIMIDERFCGPPASGNGGYTAGLIAAGCPWTTVTVTLRTPPPLGTPLSVLPGPPDGSVEVRHGEVLVAEAREGSLTSPPVPAAPYEDAGEYPGFAHHPFPSCFVCGPTRDEGDGLRIFPGRLADGRTIATWRVPATATPAMTWAALDCPGGWVNDLEVRPRLLGRLTGRILRHPEPGEECLIAGRLDALDGRKALVTTTLHGAGGEVSAQAEAVWIAVSR